jgi:hypothetical protein
MQIGVSTWEAAGFLGMSEKTLRDVYGHHHPDYPRGAANAMEQRNRYRWSIRWSASNDVDYNPRNALKMLVGPGGLKPPTRPL